MLCDGLHNVQDRLVSVEVSGRILAFLFSGTTEGSVNYAVRTESRDWPTALATRTGVLLPHEGLVDLRDAVVGCLSMNGTSLSIISRRLGLLGWSRSLTMPTAELSVEASESLRSERRERARGRLRRVVGSNNTWVGVFKWIDDLAISHWKVFGSGLCDEGLENRTVLTSLPI